MGSTEMDTELLVAIYNYRQAAYVMECIDLTVRLMEEHEEIIRQQHYPSMKCEENETTTSNHNVG